MRALAVTLLSLVTMSLTAQASPSDSMKSFLTSEIQGKSVNEILCKWDDTVAVTDNDVAEVKDSILKLLPQLGIKAFQNISNIQASDLEVSGSPNCDSSLKARLFGVGIRSNFSIRVLISGTEGQEQYRIAVHNLKSEKVAQLYKGVAQFARMGLAANVMENIVKELNKDVVPVSARPLEMELDNVNGVGSLNIRFAEIAKTGELYSLSIMDDGSLFATNQLNVDLNGQTISTGPVETYEIQSVARCICAASMTVRSGSGKLGHVLDTQKVASIKVRVKGKEVKEVDLQNPPGDIRHYYAGSSSDAWVKSALAKKGIQLGEKDSMSLISFTGSVTLYEDAEGTNPIQD